MSRNRKGIQIVISGFSGAGKGTVVKKLLEQYPNYTLSISATTRKPRQGEQNGREYFFKTEEEFKAMIQQGKLIEYAQYVNHYYGTPKEYVEQQLDKAKWNVDIVLSHTVPIEAEPVWAFIPGLDQSAVDKTTEKWLQKIYDRLDFTEWYAGHYHVESEECGIRIMYEDYDEICAEG